MTKIFKDCKLHLPYRLVQLKNLCTSVYKRHTLLKTGIHFYIFGNFWLTFFKVNFFYFIGNPMGVMIANVLAPIIVNDKTDIPFMVCFSRKAVSKNY